jgi:hypothetical protein
MSNQILDSGLFPVRIGCGLTYSNNTISTLGDNVLNFVSVVNSTDIGLTAGATFSGTSEEVSLYDSVVVAVKTDQDGVLQIQFSNDDVNWDSTLMRYYRTNQIEAPHRFTITRKYVRVIFVNTSSSNQTYLRLQTVYGSKTALNAPIDSIISQDFDSIAVRPTNYTYETALGRRQGSTTWNMFGYNNDLDIGTETIWSAGGTFSKMTAAATLSVSSTSASDTSGGVGANSIVIYGVDANWNTQVEVVTLSGTSSVTTSGTWLGVNRMDIYLAGSSESNVGVISATATGGGSSLQGQIPVGEGSTQNAFIFVPINHQFLADFLAVGAEKTGGGSSPKVRLKGWVFSDVSNAKYLVFNLLIDTSVENTHEINPSQPFVIGEKSILYFEATTDTNDTFVSCRFSGILFRDVDA